MGIRVITCLMLFVSACTEVDVMLTWSDNLISLQGEICTQPAQEVSIPVRVLFVVDVTSSMGYVDSQGQPFGNDPYDLRADAVQRAIEQYCHQDNYAFGLIRFAEDSGQTSDIGPDQPEDLTGGFIDCNQDLNLNAKFGVALKKLAEADGWTPYITTLSLVQRVLADDIASLPEDVAPTSRYVVVFLSDGEPCHLTQADSNEWVMTGEDFDEVFRQIEGIMELEKKVGDIIFHTSYLQNDSVDDCNNLWDDEITSPESLLSSMAKKGSGEFRLFEQAEDIDFLDLVDGTVYRSFELSYVIASNRNARLSIVDNELVLAPDSDADGLVDQDEEKFGTDPTLEDTDADGCRDGVEVLRGYWPLTGVESDPSASSDPCGNNYWDGVHQDTDADGLYDREELLVTLTNRMQPDSDSDGLPDGVEFFSGTNPHHNDILIPINTDADTRSNWLEAQMHTLPQVEEERYRSGGLAFFSYQYQSGFVGDGPDGTRCYSIEVGNISLVETSPGFPTMDQPTYNNTIDLYLVEHAIGSDAQAPIYLKSTYHKWYTQVDPIPKDQTRIEIKQEDFEILQQP